MATQVPARDYLIEECDVTTTTDVVRHITKGYYQVAEFDEVAIFDGTSEIRVKKFEFEKLKLKKLAKLVR